MTIDDLITMLTQLKDKRTSEDPSVYARQLHSDGHTCWYDEDFREVVGVEIQDGSVTIITRG